MHAVHALMMYLKIIHTTLTNLGEVHYFPPHISMSLSRLKGSSVGSASEISGPTGKILVPQDEDDDL